LAEHAPAEDVALEFARFRRDGALTRGEHAIEPPCLSVALGSAYLLGSAVLLVLPFFVGCASMKDTPQQEYVWEMGRICDSRSNTWYMDKVEPDGGYTIRGATNSIAGPNLPYFDCMNEQFKVHPFADWLKTK
jgi:hypothetical protein